VMALVSAGILRRKPQEATPGIASPKILEN
jgi:hypothetical protein